MFPRSSWTRSGCRRHVTGGPGLLPEAHELPDAHPDLPLARPLYRDLPLRLAEFGSVYRYEKSGALHGLTRVRGSPRTTRIFVTADQLETEATHVLEFVISMLRDFGLDDFDLELSMRDDEKSKWIGSDEFWRRRRALRNVAVASGLELVPDPGGAAFYGPKIDLRRATRSAAPGRCRPSSSTSTSPSASSSSTPDPTARSTARHDPPRAVRLGRALLRDPARALRGRVPGVARARAGRRHPRRGRLRAYLDEIVARLRAAGVRAEVDHSDDRMPKKIRTHTTQKVPLQLIAGEQDRSAARLVPLPRRVADQRHPGR
jgi:threonyl-tRNA synthetase